jgi:hypothetical protein
MIHFTEQLEAFLEQAAKEKPVSELVDIINILREKIHNVSPFKNEPVDFVKWVAKENVFANDYNPNKVAPPEMQLLEISIVNDGYTQPIVTMPKDDDEYEVIDGFHRNRVGKESSVVAERIQGFLPVVAIRKEQMSKSDRIASTIRHNRARGKHTVDAMSEIVVELKNRNWKNERIGRELGMDEDEILRLCQITGLQDLFKDDDFSRSWDIADSTVDVDYFDGVVTDDEKEAENFRTTNTSDGDRIFHTFDKWECHKAGFYATNKEGMTKEQCEAEYAKLLTDDKKFSDTLGKIITEWKHSCEHYLTNKSMNRVAWLGQAALCYAVGIPSTFRGGFHLLSEPQQENANKIAHTYLNKWLVANGREEVEYETALLVGRQMEIY